MARKQKAYFARDHTVSTYTNPKRKRGIDLSIPSYPGGWRRSSGESRLEAPTPSLALRVSRNPHRSPGESSLESGIPSVVLRVRKVGMGHARVGARDHQPRRSGLVLRHATSAQPARTRNTNRTQWQFRSIARVTRHPAAPGEVQTGLPAVHEPTSPEHAAGWTCRRTEVGFVRKATRLGFEPRKTGPKPVVIPFHHRVSYFILTSPVLLGKSTPDRKFLLEYFGPYTLGVQAVR